MAKIAKILPLPVETKAGEMTMKNALAERGYMRHPGTGVGFPPLRSPNGKYKTGLDEHADYLNFMMPEAREVEKEIIRERRERLEKATGLMSDPNDPEKTGLGPRSPYYSSIFDTGKMNTHEVASRVKLIDGENVFNFGNAFKEVEYWWAIQNTDLIAPSIEQWRAGRCKPTVQFYINNPEAEAEAIYNEKRAANKAIQYLEKMSLDRRLKVAKLLGLPVTNSDKEQIVYNQLDNFIRSGEVKFGDNKGQRAVTLFNRMVEIAPELLTVKSIVREAVNLRVYVRKGTSTALYEGERIIAQSEEELVRDLALPGKESEVKALEIRVSDRQKMKQGMSSNYTPAYSVEEPKQVEAPKEVIPEPNKKAEALKKARAAKKDKKEQTIQE